MTNTKLSYEEQVNKRVADIKEDMMREINNTLMWMSEINDGEDRERKQKEAKEMLMDTMGELARMMDKAYQQQEVLVERKRGNEKILNPQKFSLLVK